MEERNRILLPIRYSAWLSGDFGRWLERDLRHGLGGVPGVRILRMVGGFMVEADEEPGPLLEAVHRVVGEMERGMKVRYPVFHRAMGPLWSGTMQVVFPTESSRVAA